MSNVEKMVLFQSFIVASIILWFVHDRLLNMLPTLLTYTPLQKKIFNKVVYIGTVTVVGIGILSI